MFFWICLGFTVYGYLLGGIYWWLIQQEVPLSIRIPVMVLGGVAMALFVGLGERILQ